MIYLISGLFTLLILPIIITIYGFFDKEQSKLYLGVFLFGKIKIFSGYITIKQSVLYFHVSSKKAIAFNLSSIIEIKNSPKFISALNVLTLESVLNISYNNFLSLFLAESYYVVNKIICSVIYDKNRFVKIKNDVVLREEENVNYFFKVIISINLLNIIIELVKFIIFKVGKLWNKKIKSKI